MHNGSRRNKKSNEKLISPYYFFTESSINIHYFYIYILKYKLSVLHRAALGIVYRRIEIFNISYCIYYVKMNELLFGINCYMQ